MKIFAVSDLHLSTTGSKPMEIFGESWNNYIQKIIDSWNKKVSEDDIVLISGDISWAMQLDEAMADLEVIKNLKGKKIMVRGNHDYWWKSISKIRNVLPDGFFALQNDSVGFNGIVICGTRGWTVEGGADFTANDKKIYLRECERLRLALTSADRLRNDGDKTIAMIHYPPFNARREPSLFTQMFEEFGVNAVTYGHLHGKECRTDKFLTKNKISYYLTACDQINFDLVEIVL